jgi:hypothetical protein
MLRSRSHLPLRFSLVLGGLGVCLATAAVTASATPPVGAIAGPVVARGTVAETVGIGTPVTRTVTRKVKVRVRGRTITKRVRIQVKTADTVIACSIATPCEIAVQQVTIPPGGSSGWHTHPGATFVAVAQGQGTLYHAGAAGTPCTAHAYAPGGGFYQSFKDAHVLRNEGTTNLVTYATYILPPGTPNTAIRTDQPQPANCPAIL